MQRLILDELNKEWRVQSRWFWWHALGVMAQALHPERFYDEGGEREEYFVPVDGELRKSMEFAAWALTRSEYTSGLRAMASLERRGLVQTRIRICREGHREKQVALSVDLSTLKSTHSKGVTG